MKMTIWNEDLKDIKNWKRSRSGSFKCVNFICALAMISLGVILAIDLLKIIGA